MFQSLLSETFLFIPFYCFHKDFRFFRNWIVVVCWIAVETFQPPAYCFLLTKGSYLFYLTKHLFLLSFQTHISHNICQTSMRGKHTCQTILRNTTSSLGEKTFQFISMQHFLPFSMIYSWDQISIPYNYASLLLNSWHLSEMSRIRCRVLLQSAMSRQKNDPSMHFHWLTIEAILSKM